MLGEIIQFGWRAMLAIKKTGRKVATRPELAAIYNRPILAMLLLRIFSLFVIADL